MNILTKFRVSSVSCLKLSCRSYKQKLNMNTIYFRHQKEEKKVHINFRFVSQELGIDRVFNFARNEDERVDNCLERIRTNVEKEFVKKFNRKKKKKKNENTDTEQSESKTVSIKLVRNGDLVKDFNLMELSSISNDLELFISDEPVAVAYNLPWISSITLPTSILATCYVYPSKIEMQCSNPAETTYVWYKGKPNEKEKNDDAISWTEISHKSPYLVEASDIGYKLKLVCTPRNGSKTGPTADCVSTCTVEAGPGVCLFEQRHLYTQKILPDDMFRVVTYNLLADLYADSDYSRSILFPYCPPYALAIDYRKQLFMKEIAGYNADIICLQEVDGKVFDLDLLPFLQMSNYIGMYKSKGATAEGLATFVNSKKFSLVKNCGINIGENISTLDIFDELWRKIQSNEPLVKRITERSTAVHVTTVKSNDSDKVLVIANTHLYFHPDAAHIRLLQIAFCMKYVESVYHQTKQELNLDENDISIIFCGDFNSVPDGGIFKLMTQRHVEENFVDFQSNESEAVKDVSLSQPFEFKSAYEISPKYTNFTVLFAACLDYIFYQSTNLHVIQTIPVPSDEELQSHTAIPSVVHPSDHIALIADLEWTKN